MKDYRTQPQILFQRSSILSSFYMLWLLLFFKDRESYHNIFSHRNKIKCIVLCRHNQQKKIESTNNKPSL